jgi:osmoprotectant transport system ATP-binding protein
VIIFDDVTKQFPDGTRAVDGFNLTLPAHKTTVFVGSSGCGKTTLLRMINRMVEPSSGVVSIDGEDIAGKDPVKLRRGIGYVMQNSGLLPHYTVIDNIATVPVLQGLSRSAARSRGLELMDTVGLDR